MEFDTTLTQNNVDMNGMPEFGDEPIDGYHTQSRLESETKGVLNEKITELFHFCDVENKGYVVKEDLYRLRDELGLDSYDIDYAFDELDANKDSILSMEEFTTGFGLFIGVGQTPVSGANGHSNEDITENDQEIKIDFSFQVFNLMDKDDKGHITKEDLIESADTLEIDPSQIDYVFKRLRGTSIDKIHFEDFVNNIGSIVALSPALQEIKEAEEKKEKELDKIKIIERAFKMDLSGYDEGDIEKLLHEQATILFKRCDYDNKNYVTKEDLLTLASELDLSCEQVTEAFDKLNVNNRDFLTLREFINGFGVFLGIEQSLQRDGENEAIIENEELEKAIELFNACDINNRGYVSPYDLRQLTNVLGLSEQQVTMIFQQLDDDNNGFITLNEFVNGFSHFTSVSNENNNEELKGRVTKDDSIDEIYFTDSTQTRTKESVSREILERSDSQASKGSERNFIKRQMSIRYESGATEVDEMMHTLEEEFGSSISKDQLQQLWSSVSLTGDLNTTRMFENFLGKVYGELRTAKQEAKHLEDVLEKKSQSHTEEIKKIYDDMEIQMQTEKLKQKQQLAEKENLLREDMFRELKEKERQIEKMMQRENTLQNRLGHIKEQEVSLKHQNTKLQKENLQLEDQLNDSMTNMSYLKSSLQHMEEQTTAEKKETLKAAVQATQGIQSEHESLVKQLDLLRTTNQKLRDERDSLELSIRSKTTNEEMDGTEEYVSNHRKVTRHGSNMGNYVNERTSSTPTHSPITKQGSIMSNYFEPMGNHHHPVFDESNHLSNIGEIDSTFEATLEMEDPLGTGEQIVSSPEISRREECTPSTSPTPSSPRQEPVGMNNEEEHFSDNISSISQTIPTETPNRVYKCVFVGDSGVGKSSFIYRFCFDEFQKNFSATIGVDMHVKTIKAKGQWVALQLWDTAGQERFRSITKNYFRRADGVIIMFDVTSETSFLNVKGWMLDVEEGAEPDCQILLLGNKTDICKKHPKRRKITPEMAGKVAEDYNAIYHEVSALSGVGVLEAINELALRMTDNEDRLMQKSVLNINRIGKKDLGEKKKGCCR